MAGSVYPIAGYALFPPSCHDYGVTNHTRISG